MDVPRHEVRSLSFDTFYRTERDRLVRAMALTLGDVSFAADAVDEAMARAFGKWRTVGDYGNPQGWVYRVGLNWARSRLRRTRREAIGLVPSVPVWDPEVPDPGLWERVEALPSHQRSVVVLRYYLDWSISQIADAMGIRTGTVKSRLHRALAELRTSVEVER